MTPRELRKSRAINHEIYERDEQDELVALPAPDVVEGERRESAVPLRSPSDLPQPTGTFEVEVAAATDAFDEVPSTAAIVDGEALDVDAIVADLASASRAAPRRRLLGVRLPRWASPAWVVSAGVHVAMLFVCGSLTSALLVSEYAPMDVSAVEIDLQPPEVLADSPPPIETDRAVDASELSEVAALGDPTAKLRESFGDDFEPLANPAPVESAGGLGTLNALPSDLGTLMVGVGDDQMVGADSGMLPGGGSGGKGRGGRKGGSPSGKAQGKSNFFGTEAVGDRIVFLLDNSGSMKQGRMETTVMELLRSVDGLTDKQMFYVVFYSDQAYPMFYPNSVMQMVPANRENKQWLLPWAQTVELCMGGELVKALELAASLHPSVVYVLSDGDIDSPRTMERLTQANDWDFVVHTLGMGVKKPVDAQNLTAIAAAYRGTFQMVGPAPAAMAHARTNPIRSNGRGVAWGMGAGVGVRRP